MIRAWLAIVVWGVFLLVIGVPVLLVGLVYPPRRLIAWASALWARVMLAVCGVELNIEGREHIADGRPRCFLGNHQSALDIPILLVALKGNVRFVAKNTLFRYPIFGWVLWRYGYVSVNRSSPRRALRSLDRMVERIVRDPISVAVFPEGTRTPDGRLLPFRQGTMKICQRTGLPAVPFAIDGSFRVNPRDRLRAYPGRVRLCFARPIPTDEMAALSAAELHRRVRSAVEGLLSDAAGAEKPADTAIGLDQRDDEQRSDLAAAAHS